MSTPRTTSSSACARENRKSALAASDVRTTDVTNDVLHDGSIVGAPHTAQIEVFIAIAREINTYSEPALIVGKLAQALQPYIQFSSICLSVLQEETLVCIASSDPKHWIEPKTRQSHPDHYLWLLIDGDKSLDLSVTGQGLFDTKTEPPGLMTFINVPLMVEGRVFGLLHIDNYGEHTWAEAEIGLARLVGGQIAAVVQGSQELQRRRAREAELARSLALLNATQEAVAEGICLVAPSGEVTSYNQRFATLWNLTVAQAAQMHEEGNLMTHVLEQLADPDEFIFKLGELYEQPNALARDEISLRDGRILERYSAPAIAPAVGEEAEINCGRVWTFHDISNRKLYEAQLRHQAFHDALTGLPNRILLVERMERARLKLERSRRALAVLFLDLDRFKVINDSLGHDKGDELLKQVASRLQNCLRPGDTAARFGGDEFVILLEEVTGSDDAVQVARRIADSLRQPFDLVGAELALTTSIGIVLSNSPAEAPDELMRRADIAMYRAKNNGKAQFYLWDEHISESTISDLQLEIELHGAIKRGELEVWYQPLIDLHDEVTDGKSGGKPRPQGFEALVRWRHPVRGLVPPNNWIPIAEESNLVQSIDAYVARIACAQIVEWNARRAALGKAPLSIHLNLSARSFESHDIAANIQRILDECGLPAALLTLEITESAIMRDTDKAIEQLSQLKKLGVGLAIDDFGTGRSSLAYLEFLPVDWFEIDRTFVARMGVSDAIVRAIVSLSQALQVEVVAEGVETAQQLEQLRALDCQWVQGFLFGKPLPARDAEALV